MSCLLEMHTLRSKLTDLANLSCFFLMTVLHVLTGSVYCVMAFLPPSRDIYWRYPIRNLEWFFSVPLITEILVHVGCSSDCLCSKVRGNEKSEDPFANSQVQMKDQAEMRKKFLSDSPLPVDGNDENNCNNCRANIISQV